MTETTTKRATPADAGCWIDGWMGQYAVAEMVTIAAAHGYADAEIIDIATRKLACMGASTAPEITIDEEETLSFAADEVEQWMNENVAPEGHYFQWFDGEFFLSADEDPEPDEEEETNPYAGPGGLLDEVRQAERLLGTW